MKPTASVLADVHVNYICLFCKDNKNIAKNTVIVRNSLHISFCFCT